MKREVLEESSRELVHIERSIEELKLKNRDMRAVQFEQEKRIKILQQNSGDLQVSKEQLEADYERIKQKMADREIEIVDCEQALTREQERERSNLDRRRELMERIELLSQKSLVLERHQQQMEREIFQFIEENERIRKALYNRDLEAERAKQRNKQILQRSEFHLQ